MVQKELVESYQAFYPGTTEEAASGAIEMWIAGKGQLPAGLVNGSELWRAVVEAYFASNNLPVPESLKEPLVDPGCAPSATE